MFTSLTSNFDFTLKAVALALFFLSLTYVGFGFIFRLSFKMLRIKFSNSKLSKIDEQLFDLQLIRLCHGITLETVSDIELYSEAIRSGAIKAPKGWLLPSYQAAGQRRLKKSESVATYLIAILLAVFIIAFTVSVTKGQKYNYAEFSNSSNEHVLVSDIYVYNPTTKHYYNKNRCIALPSTSKEIIRTACDYMLTSDPQMKKELQDAIKTNNKNFRIVGYICAMMYLIIICIFFAYPRFYKFNNAFYDYKTSRKDPS
ncbi:hypothetical protein HGT70_08865 [Rosenbergiella collisarenosi]|uniref:hypothetical protein n=1 Tax=Rosenbergiella collisarenosi TaxID=1544695 RepID=UPI001BDAF9E1|nr:hypothetical protein [Rosenbergiella collisarenosi]MBT0721396.1 hypothetical protein [Rosenbergiella collisarenosi]